MLVGLMLGSVWSMNFSATSVATSAHIIGTHVIVSYICVRRSQRNMYTYAYMHVYTNAERETYVDLYIYAHMHMYAYVNE